MIHLYLHPQSNLPTRRTADNPIPAPMHHGNGGDGRDAVAAQLGQLVTGGGVDVDEPVHVADAETLDWGLGVLLPLGAEAVVFYTLALALA